VADTDARAEGKHSIGLIWWLLAREVLRLRGTFARTGENAWPIMVRLRALCAR